MKVTISPAQEQVSQDIFKPGSLVQADDWVMLVTDGGVHSKNSFCGVYLAGDSTHYTVGHWDNDWNKGNFTKFVGTITLEQE